MHNVNRYPAPFVQLNKALILGGGQWLPPRSRAVSSSSAVRDGDDVANGNQAVQSYYWGGTSKRYALAMRCSGLLPARPACR